MEDKTYQTQFNNQISLQKSFSGFSEMSTPKKGEEDTYQMGAKMNLLTADICDRPRKSLAKRKAKETKRNIILTILMMRKRKA